jgi:hypothetical protein
VVDVENIHVNALMVERNGVMVVVIINVNVIIQIKINQDVVVIHV